MSAEKNNAEIDTLLGFILNQKDRRKYRVALFMGDNNSTEIISIAKKHLEVGSYVKVLPLLETTIDEKPVAFYGVVTSPVKFKPIAQFSQTVLNHLIARILNMRSQEIYRHIIPVFEIQILDLENNPSFIEPSIFWLVKPLDENIPLGLVAKGAIKIGSLKGRSEQKIYLPKDFINKHVLVTGTTGSGKTSLLLSLAEKLNGAGYLPVVFDFDGDIIHKIRNFSNEHKKRFVILAHKSLKMSEEERPVSIKFEDHRARRMIVNALLNTLGQYGSATDTAIFSKLINKCNEKIRDLKEQDIFDWLYKRLNETKNEISNDNLLKRYLNVIERLINHFIIEFNFNIKTSNKNYDHQKNVADHNDKQSNIINIHSNDNAHNHLDLDEVIARNVNKIFVIGSIRNKLMPLSFAMEFLAFLIKLFEIAVKNKYSKSIVLLLDEAHYIFDIPRFVKYSMSYELLRILRVGRRVNLHFVLATHALGYLGPEIKNLANTWIVLKTIASGIREEIKEVFPYIDPDILLYLKPGEALLLNPEIHIALTIQIDKPSAD